MHTTHQPIRHLIADRDGVLNREAGQGWVTHPEAWAWEAGALDALRLLAERGIRVSVATNQSCIGRGLASRQEIEAVHRRMRREAAAAEGPIAAVFYCPHAPGEGCDCRKPRPGLLHRAVAASHMPTDVALFVGDASRDLEAGRAAGVPTVLVRTGKGRATEAAGDLRQPVFDDLLAVVRCLVAGHDPRLSIPLTEAPR